MYMYVLCVYWSVFAGIGMYYNHRDMSEKMAKYKNTYWFVFTCICMY